MKTFKQHITEVNVKSLMNTVKSKYKVSKTSDKSFLFGDDLEYEIYQDGGKTYLQIDDDKNSKEIEITKDTDILKAIKEL